MAKAAVKANPKAGETKTAPATKAVAIVLPNSKAMSTDVGAKIVSAFVSVFEQDKQIAEMTRDVDKRRHDVLASMTSAIVKAANNDPNIDLTDVFSGEQKKINALNQLLMLAMGIQEVVTVGKEGAKTQKVQYTKEVAKFFPTAKDEKGSEAHSKKVTQRTTFLHQLKRTIQAAHAIREENITFKTDQATGTLAISGKTVEKHFGVPAVIVNEKQTIETGTGDNVQKTKLKVKPSFTELARIGAAVAGKAVQGRTQRSTAPTGVVASDKALINIAKEFVKALGLYKGEVTEPLSEALKGVANAVTVTMERKAAA